MVVTVFRDDQREKAPFVILNHGRGTTAQDRAKMSRSRYPDVSRYLVERGFVVLLPTRVGYGETGGSDLERPFGSCFQWTYDATFEAGAIETVALAAEARRKPYVDADHGVLLGNSYGGAVTVAALARKPPGIVAGINFAGGGGGDPVRYPAKPCNEPALRTFFADAGRHSTLPSLWLYSANDLFWGEELPVEWHKAFVAAGGNARFVHLPADGANGHGIFTNNIPAWKPVVDEFLRSIGL
jgi:dienelactone hydrolase